MYKKNIFTKQAFTMIELIIVIVVIGILATVMIPNMEPVPARDAANQLSRHIQYAQHLSMVDDVYDDADASWPKNRWGVLIGTGGKYRVQTGTGTYAKDPLTKEDLDGSSITDLNRKFKVTSITTDCGVGGLSFDNFGRPYTSAGIWSAATPTAGRMINNDCLITVTTNTKSAHFTINRQTGYVGDVIVP